MKFHCERCKTRYSIADERVRGKILKIRCKSCSAVISVREGGVTATEDAAARSGGWSVTGDPLAIDPAAGAGAGVVADAMLDAAFSAPTVQDSSAAVRAAMEAAAASGPAAPPATLEEEWFLSAEGQEDGPFSLERARAWVSTRPPDEVLHCWCEGFDDWLPVEKVSHFRGLRGGGKGRAGRPSGPQSVVAPLPSASQSMPALPATSSSVAAPLPAAPAPPPAPMMPSREDTPLPLFASTLAALEEQARSEPAKPTKTAAVAPASAASAAKPRDAAAPSPARDRAGSGPVAAPPAIPRDAAAPSPVRDKGGSGPVRDKGGSGPVPAIPAHPRDAAASSSGKRDAAGAGKREGATTGATPAIAAESPAAGAAKLPPTPVAGNKKSSSLSDAFADAAKAGAEAPAAAPAAPEPKAAPPAPPLRLVPPPGAAAPAGATKPGRAPPPPPPPLPASAKAGRSATPSALPAVPPPPMPSVPAPPAPSVPAPPIAASSASRLAVARAQPEPIAEPPTAPPVPAPPPPTPAPPPLVPAAAAGGEPRSLFAAALAALDASGPSGGEGETAGARGDGAAGDAAPELEFDISEASRVVKLPNLATLAAEGLPIRQPRMAGLSRPTVTKLGAGTGDEPAVTGPPLAAASAPPPLSAEAIAAATPAVLQPTKRGGGHLAQILIGGGLLAVVAGIMLVVALSSGDSEDTGLARSRIVDERLGYSPDTPGRTRPGGTEAKAGETGDDGEVVGSTRMHRNTPRTTPRRPDETTPPVTTEGGKIDDFTGDDDANRPLDGEDLLATYRDNSLGLKLCYEQALKRDPLLDVRRLDVAIRVSPTGTVTDVTMPGNDSALGSCIIAKIRRWKFRKSPEEFRGQFPLVFKN